MAEAASLSCLGGIAGYGALDKNSFSTSGKSENTYYLALPIFTLRNLLLRQMFLSLSLGEVIPLIPECPPFPLGKLVAMDWPRPGLKLHFTA